NSPTGPDRRSRGLLFGESRMAEVARSCPDCRCSLRPIRVLDATAPGPLIRRGKGATHVTLSYAAPDAKPSWFTASVPREGVVRGWICPECGRILLYGEAKP